MPNYYSNTDRVSKGGNFNFSGSGLIDGVDNLFATELFRYGIIKASDKLWRNVISPEELRTNELVLPGYSSYNSLENFADALSLAVSGFSCKLAQEYVDEAEQLGVAQPVFSMAKPVAIWGISSERLSKEYAHWLEQPNTATAAMFFALSEKPVMYNANIVCENLRTDNYLVNKPLANLLGKLAPFYVYNQICEIGRAATSAELKQTEVDKDEVKAKFRSWSDKYAYLKTSKPLQLAAFNAALNSEYEHEIKKLICSKPFSAENRDFRHYKGSITFVLNKSTKYQYENEALVACREVLPASTNLTRKKLTSASNKLTKVHVLKFMYAVSEKLPITIRNEDIDSMYSELRRILRLYEALHGTFSYRLAPAYKQLAQKFESTFERSFRHWATPGNTAKHEVLQWLLYERDSTAYKQAVKNAQIKQVVRPVNLANTFKHYNNLKLKTNIEAYLRDYITAYNQSHAKNQNKKAKTKASKKISKVSNQAKPGSNNKAIDTASVQASDVTNTDPGC
jgi:hypothetical protein